SVPLALVLVRYHDLHVARTLENRRGPPLRGRHEPLELGPLVDHGVLHHQLVRVERFVVLPRVLLRVRDRRLEDLLDLFRGVLLREREQRQCVVHVLPANLIDDQPHFVRRLAGGPLNGSYARHLTSLLAVRPHPTEPPPARRLPALRPRATPSCRPPWRPSGRGTTASARTRLTCGRPCSRSRTRG